MSILLSRVRECLADGAFVRIAEPDGGHLGTRYITHRGKTAGRTVERLSAILRAAGFCVRAVEYWATAAALYANAELLKLAPIQRSALVDPRYHDPSFRLSSLIIDGIVDKRLDATRRLPADIDNGFVGVAPANTRTVLTPVENFKQLRITRDCYMELEYVPSAPPELPECVPADVIDRFLNTRFINGGNDRSALENRPLPILARVDEALLCLIENAEGTLFSGNTVLRTPGYLTLVAPEHPVVRSGGGAYFAKLTSTGTPDILGDTLVFFDGNYFNYYHWIVDALVSLWMLHDSGLSAPTLLVPQHRNQPNPKFIDQSLALLDLPFTTPDPTLDLVRLERAFWIENHRTHAFQSPALLKLSSRMKELAWANADKGRDASPSMRLLVERSGSRLIANSEEVRRRLDDLGFTACRPEELDFAAQVRLFSKAEIVIGVHGAGLVNAVFCPPHARLIEIMPDTLHRPHFWAICRLIGLRHIIFEAPISDVHTLSVTVNAELLADLVEKILKE